jgi:hypothetical protein
MQQPQPPPRLIPLLIHFVLDQVRLGFVSEARDTVRH